MTAHNYRIEASDLVRRYGRYTALDGVSFAVEGPAVLAMVGKNGSGKSTLMRLLNGWEKPSSGSITVDGRTPYDCGKVLKDMIFIDEKVEFDFTLTLAGILEKCAFMDRRFDLRYAHEMADGFGLGLKKRQSQLSKGMRNQFNIIVALAFNRPVTVMDEPVSGLDEASRKLFYSLLVRSQNENPRLFIISTHLLGEFEQYADTFMVLTRGKIAAYDARETFETLLVRVTGLGENVDKVVEGLQVYETKTFAGMKSVTVANLIDRAGKKFAAEHNVDIRHVPVNDVCTLLGELDA